MTVSLSPALFVCLFTMPSAFGQVASMTESWVDDYDPQAGAVVGCGVTDGNYDWEIHQTRVETSITSPSGRYDLTFSEDTKYPQQSGLYPYARAELSLAWDWNDMGSYVVESHPTSSCPVADFGTTLFGGTAGYSKICYQYDHTDNTFLNPFV